ncbi:MAG: hypothetical protein JO262_10420 [Solirubrobacterales bacterium]|nr:hypothetical protein [Solirubrobacterales bacterium]
MLRRTLTAAAIAAVLAGSVGVAAPIRARGSPRNASPRSAARSPVPDRMDWEKIQTAAALRHMALAPHRTARFRAFAAQLGLRELVSIHPLAPGRCLTAVRDLYNNLLDLENAFPGENWGPLRRAVAREPSIRACAARRG